MRFSRRGYLVYADTDYHTDRQMAKIPPEELERRGVQSNKGPRSLLDLVRRWLVWRDVPERDVKTDGGEMADVETAGAARIPLAELERRGMRSHKGTAPVMKFLRRRRMRQEAREHGEQAVDVETDGVEPDDPTRISPEELERRGVRSNKGSGILRNLLRRCLTWREGSEDDVGADGS